MRRRVGALCAWSLLFNVVAAQYVRAPRGSRQPHARDGQASTSNNTETSTAVYLLSYDDFCLFGPPSPFAYVENNGTAAVSWCAAPGHGTRLIPDGTLHGVRYVRAASWAQVSGVGDFTKINLAPGDGGGQLSDAGNAPGAAQVWVGEGEQAQSWVMIISATTFCFRACSSAEYCPTDYASLGCYYFTGDQVGTDGTWEDCTATDGSPPGVSGSATYTYVSGAGPTATPSGAAPASCSSSSSVSNGQSAPPDYSWGSYTVAGGTSGSGAGAGAGASVTGGTTVGAGAASALASASASASGTAASTSGSYVAVTTCTPCSAGASQSAAASGVSTVSGGATTAGAALAVSSGSGTASAASTLAGTASAAASGATTASAGATEQAGITQNDVELTVRAAASAAEPTSATKPPAGLWGRQESSGSCCTTAWVLASSSTGLPLSESAAAAAGTSGSTKATSASAAGSSASSSGASGSLSANGSTPAGTNTTSGAVGRAGGWTAGAEGGWRVAVSAALGAAVLAAAWAAV